MLNQTSFLHQPFVWVSREVFGSRKFICPKNPWDVGCWGVKLNLFWGPETGCHFWRVWCFHSFGVRILRVMRNCRKWTFAGFGRFRTLSCHQALAVCVSSIRRRHVSSPYYCGWSTNPPNVPPPQNTPSEIRPRAYKPLVSLSKAFLDSYFWGGVRLGRHRLTSHDSRQ